MWRAPSLIKHSLFGLVMLPLVFSQHTLSVGQSYSIQHCLEERQSVNTVDVVRSTQFYSYTDTGTGLQDVYAIDTTLPNTPNARSACRRFFSDTQNNAAFVQAGDDTYLIELNSVSNDPRATEMTAQGCFAQLTGIGGQFVPPAQISIQPPLIVNIPATGQPVLTPPVEFLLIPSYIGKIPQLHSQAESLPLIPLNNRRGFQFSIPLTWLSDALQFMNGQVTQTQADWIVNYYVAQMTGWQLESGSLLMGSSGDAFTFRLVNYQGSTLYFQVRLSLFTNALNIEVLAPEPRWGGSGQTLGSGLMGSSLNAAGKELLINQMMTLASALFANDEYEVYIQQDAEDLSIHRYLEFALLSSGGYAISRNETVRQTSLTCSLPAWIPVTP
jgi:hypothetical protein